MRRLSAFLCAVALLCTVLPLGGCRFGDAAVAYDPDSYRVAFTDNWRFGMLDTRLQACYGALYTAVTQTADKNVTVQVKGDRRYGVAVRLPSPLYSEEEVRLLFEAFSADNPQFFFLSNTFTYSGDFDNYTGFTLLYVCDAATRTSFGSQLDAAVQSFTADCPTDDAYAAELYLHDALAAACTYDDATAAAPDEGDPLSFTAYGALVKGNAVCEGYSRAMQMLLSRMGIDSTLVTGVAPDTGVSHMWNMVRVDGETYHLDTTWNDSGDTLHHRYFNLTDEAVSRSRSVHDIGLPACTATAANYFYRAGRYIDTFDRKAIAGVVAEAVRRGDASVQLCFAPDKYANGALLLSNTPQLAAMVREFLPEGATFSDYRLAGNPEEYILTVLF